MRTVIAGCSFWFAMSLLGCGGDRVGETKPAPVLAEAERQAALSLYAAQDCGVCHGEAAEGGELGPALGELAPYWDVERLAVYLRDPDAYRAAHPDFEERRDAEYEMEMPAFDHLSEAEVTLLARWLMSR